MSSEQLGHRELLIPSTVARIAIVDSAIMSESE
jgi:hypothetical protein